MNAVTEPLGENFDYEHMEALLLFMTDILLQKDLIKRRSEDYKADEIIQKQTGIQEQTVQFGKDEIFVIELCSPFGNTLKSKMQFDRIMASYVLLAVLKCLANKYEYGSIEIFQKLAMSFLHTKGKEMLDVLDHTR
jgi:hypothetical protein